MTFGTDDAFSAFFQIVNKFIPDPAQKAAAIQEHEKLVQDMNLAILDANTKAQIGQIDVNKVEAANTNLFVSGWRPAAGWACVSALIYQMIFRPVLGWIMINLAGWSMPPALETDTLMTLLFGLLGLGGYRMAEKIKGVASK